LTGRCQVDKIKARTQEGVNLKMEKHKLTAKKRTIFGKKVKKLRAQGELPSNIYGKGIKSEALSIILKDFQKAYREVGETGVIYLTIEADPKERPVLFHNLQRDPVNNNPLHVDFYQVDLKEKINAKVSVVAMGEAKAVTEKVGVLLQPLNEVEVEALPTDLPEKVEIDVVKLSQIDEALSVKDIKVDKTKINILTNPDEIVFKIGPLITKEMEEQIAAEKAAAEAAATIAAPEEKVETQTPTEGEAAPAAEQLLEEKQEPQTHKPQK